MTGGRVHIPSAWNCAGRRRSLGIPSHENGVGPRGETAPPGHGRCSFAIRRGLPASNTLEPRRGALQGLSAVRITPPRGLLAGTPWHLYAQDPARDTDCSLVLPREPHHHQPAARLPGGSAARRTRRARSGGGPRRARPEPGRRGQCAAPRRGRTPGAMRWVERRVRLVHHVVSIVIGLLPEQLARCIAEMGAVRARLETDAALRALRTLVAQQLPVLPAPLGFHPHRLGATNRTRARQHKMGSDPPPAPA